MPLFELTLLAKEADVQRAEAEVVAGVVEGTVPAEPEERPVGDHLHEGGPRAAGVAQQFWRGRGSFTHELVLAIQEQHAGLRQLEHRVRLPHAQRRKPRLVGL